MSERLEFFFDFISPYSYLAHTQLAGLGADVVFRPMHIMTVMKEVGNTPTTVTCAAKGRYAGADLGRWVQKYAVPFKGVNMRAFNNGACLRAVLAADSEETAARMIKALFEGSWGSGRTIQTVEEVIEVLAAAGISTDGLAVRIDDPSTVQKLEDNNREAARRGVFGAPTILIGDAMFFGNDRLDFVRDHLANGATA